MARSKHEKARLKNTFGYEVAIWRERYDMSITDLADSIGIGVGSLSSMELGNSSPTPVVVESIIKFFGIDEKASLRMRSYATNRTFTRHGWEKSDLETRLFMLLIKQHLKRNPKLKKSVVMKALKESNLQ